MAFEMKQITRKCKSKRDKINELFRSVKNNPLLTSNIKIALNKYINYKLYNRNCIYSESTMSNMINELLEHVCKKNINDITIKDIKFSENEIIYQIKRAIKYGATKSLYYELSNYSNLDLDVEPPKSTSGQRSLSEDEVVNYFKDIMI